MQIDPHTLQQILQRIYQQMRCPQCSSRVPVDFSSVRVVASGAMLLQLRCEGCGAYIVLHASLAGTDDAVDIDDVTVNESSKLNISTEEAEMLQGALKESGGSFEKLFEQYGVEEKES